MIIKINLRSLVLLLAVILILMSTNAVAIAQEGTEPETPRTPLPTRTPVQYDGDISSGDRSPIIPGGPGFISIHPSAFQPMNSSSSYDFFGSEKAISELFNPASSGMGFYLAPVDLPDQATITKLVVYVHDEIEEDLNVIKVELYQCDYGYNGCGSMVLGGWTYTPNANKYGYFETTSFVIDTVNLQSYSYVLYMEIPGGPKQDLSLVNVRVDYGFDPLFLPLVNN